MSPLRRARVRIAGGGHRVTPFELFFDLVFVFAITQITAYVHETHTALGVLQGVIVLGLLWWAWSSYTWLGNQAHADEGLIRGGMVVAMVAVFVVALTIPEAWHDQPGGLPAPMVLVVAYVGIRVIHELLYLAASSDDAGLRHQLLLNLVPLVGGGALLVAGALVEDGARTALWTGALVVDWIATYVTSMQGGGWRINSVEHWVERHGLVVIIAIGESVVAIGVGASGTPVDWRLLLGAVLGMLVAAALWWLYFDLSAEAAERALEGYDPERQVRAAIEAYTYLHFWMILGIVVSAVGIEEALAHAGDEGALGGFSAGCLCLGVTAYLAGHVFSWLRLNGTFKVQRVATAAAVAAVTPLAAAMQALAALAMVALLLGVLVAYETVRYAAVRAELSRDRR
ncbi:MAG: low temperature requirement protein A [Mycobacteriales bacterium]